MADHSAIAAVSRSLRTLLRDRMAIASEVTLAPPDIEVAGIEGARINLYLYQVQENPHLANQEIPGSGSGGYGRPPLALDLRYLMTTHSAIETTADADLNAQTLLGDAMRVLHFFGNRIDALNVTRATAGTIGDPILDPALAGEYERVKLRLHPGSLDDITKLWSALSEENFRRSVVYEVKVVQIETTEPARRAPPVQSRQVLSGPNRRPVVRRAYVTPIGSEPIGEMRVSVGEEISIEADAANAERIYVRLGGLDPIRLPPSADGRYRIRIPDDQYPPDLDIPALRPIPPAQRLQPGLLEVQLIAMNGVEGVAGALDRGASLVAERRFASNVALMQLVPEITAINPAAGSPGVLLQIHGTRLWWPAAREAWTVIGDAAVRIRPPVGADPWAAPTPIQIEIPVSEAAALLPDPPPAGTAYPVAVEIDGARSRRSFDFTLTP
ncbi:DUF4255 domain-containing protein [Kaistia granuli]|uniref:DUF4255 domain-containing protein n=1 Tax=Kaistia granuli TaxID=363259 RepID=UPI00037A4573|nr:DUF4255 domain-containing protein [Kaistia granuli]